MGADRRPLFQERSRQKGFETVSHKPVATDGHDVIIIAVQQPRIADVVGLPPVKSIPAPAPLIFSGKLLTINRQSNERKVPRFAFDPLWRLTRTTERIRWNRDADATP